MNKKGSLLLGEETLKLVIAVIALGFLAYLLFSLYFSAKTAEELKQAKASLNFLMDNVKSGSESVDIYNPKGWSLGTWPHSIDISVPFKEASRPEGEAAEYPTTCDNLGWANCICICEQDSASSCDTKGICLNNENDFIINEGSIRIDNPPITLYIDQTNKIISLAEEFGGFGGGGGFAGGGSSGKAS